MVPLAGLMAKATELAETIAGNGPLATRAAKQAGLHGLGRPLDEGIAFETDAFSYLCRSEDWLAGQQAFLARTKPVFRGK